MRYEGNIYRPPSEAYSLLVQVTVGCTHNKCTFCSMYKDKKFHIRKLEEVLEDLAWARRAYPRVERIFLCDGDALALSLNRLMPILDYIRENFPECERVTAYGRAEDALRKTDEELRKLYEAGLTMVYVGAESGSEKVLKEINKGETRQELIDGVRKIENSGMKASVTFISGLAGKAGWEDHAIETGVLCSAPYAHGGPVRADRRGDPQRQAAASHAGGSHGGDPSDAGEHQRHEEVRFPQQPRVQLPVPERRSAG